MVQSGWLGVALLVLGPLLCGCGGEEPAAPSAPSAPAPGPPPPPPPPPARPLTPPQDAAELAAVGAYLVDTWAVKITLFLDESKSFRMITLSRNGQGQRVGTGSWKLSGTDLTMVYRTLNGQEFAAAGEKVVNGYSQGNVVLRGVDAGRDLVLVRQQMVSFK